MKYFKYLSFIAVLWAACSSQKEEEGQTASTQMFERLTTEQTGIDFVNVVVESDEVNVTTYQYIYNGNGVAVGDIDNDGLLDLFFSSNQGDCKLFRNKGDFKFEDITEKAGISASHFCTGTLMGDLNNDGLLDIYVCRSNPYFSAENRANLLFINQGDLTFKEMAAEYGLADQGHSSMATIFDMDNDGDLDLFVGNHPVEFDNDIRKFSAYETQDEFSTDRLYRNDGDGKFVDITASSGVGSYAFALSMATTDFNADGLTDIYVCNDYYGPDFCYLNQGDGTFVESHQEIFKHTSTNAMGSDAADFNNDGLVDLTVMDMLPGDNYHRKLLSGPSNFDYYLIRWLNGYGHQTMKNTLQLNTGEKYYNEISCFSGTIATDWSWAPLFADLDNDGWKDLYVTNGYYRDVTNQDFVTFEANFLKKNNRNMTIDELAKQLPNKRTPNYAYRNKGDLTFEDVSAKWGLNEQTVSNGAAYADLNNDGKLDLIACNMNQQVSIYRNTGAAANYIQLKLVGDQSNRFGVGAKVTLQQADQLQYAENYPVRGYNSSVSPLIHFGLGDQPVKSIKVVWPSGKVNTVKEPEINTLLEIREAEGIIPEPEEESETPALFADVTKEVLGTIEHAESGYVDYKIEPLIPHMFSKRGPGLDVADVNGDGLEDIMMGGSAVSSCQLLLQQANGRFSERKGPWADEEAIEVVDLHFFDADQDGDQDVYLASGSNEWLTPEDKPKYQDRIYINDGKGRFTRADILPQLQYNTACVISGDLDGDGDLDLFVGGSVIPGKYPLAHPSTILINEGGQFVDGSDAWGLNLDALVSRAILHDVDGDAKLDLLIAAEWEPIRAFRNNGNTLTEVTEDWGLADKIGWWNSIDLVDADGDGDLDLLAGNIGLNAQYMADDKEQIHVDYGDLDGNGSFDAVVSQYYMGVLAPIYSKMELGNQMRYFMNKHYKFHEAYATSSTQDFLSKVKNQPERKSANCMESMLYVFENGKFTPGKLPAEAQFSPLFDFEQIDVAGTSRILGVGNAFDNKIELGWTDATNGLFMRSSSNGLTHSYGSGFFVPENAKVIRPIQVKGVPHLLVAINNGALKLFRIEQ